jgi:site-specific recombinase XerC
VMRTVGDSPEGLRLRALVVILWRAGLRISEALALAESDLDSARGAVLGGWCRSTFCGVGCAARLRRERSGWPARGDGGPG